MDQLIENSVTICASPNHQVLRISQTSYRSAPGCWEVGIGWPMHRMATDRHGSTILVNWNLPAWGVPRACQWPQQCIFCSSHCFLPAREADFPTSLRDKAPRPVAGASLETSDGNLRSRCSQAMWAMWELL